MAKQSTVTLTISVAGDGLNTSFTPTGTPLVNVAAPAGGPVGITLASGDNTILVPPGSKGLIIIPPSTSTVVKKLKGAAPDTGFSISPSILSGPIGLPTAAVSIILNAVSSEEVQIMWI